MPLLLSNNCPKLFCSVLFLSVLIELIQLELINSDRDSIRKARKGFLISKGKTLDLYGINNRNKI